jgi:hypothetical protein
LSNVEAYHLIMKVAAGEPDSVAEISAALACAAGSRRVG